MAARQWDKALVYWSISGWTRIDGDELKKPPTNKTEASLAAANFVSGLVVRTVNGNGVLTDVEFHAEELIE